ncbi:LOW QUALITY PROTEIN: cell division cycle protein 20 homolog B-like [Gouania willdenowi]|uniref:LOW QUALITY PROTEIN: cell division cycle protein 20 homolog B-like n=1 Tax=Gouania willdenowi TaxID=441366 RepID=UPI0010567DAE|nr:LOW QUALITY PROTEIN: cell division cycle protein 20 homolog B [Gouania willdenowi]
MAVTSAGPAGDTLRNHHEPLEPLSPVAPSDNATGEQRWVWENCSRNNTAYEERRCDSLPFEALNKSALCLQGRLLNDYYTNLLDCSCNGTVALALGSSVYLWNSETRTLEGHLDPHPGLQRHHMHSITCLCWSRDGTALCIGTRQGEVQLWDVEYQQNMRHIPSHWSVVGAVSCKQQLFSSGSVLGHIHHVDPRASQPLVAASVQKEGICSLQWSPGEERLASGSADGFLHIWDGNITGLTRPQQPIASMKQPSAVKAMGWCPWQRTVVATGGGWQDGELRVWETQSGRCVNSVNTNSQICALRWVEKKRCLITGHGSPHHQLTHWNWDCPSLSSVHSLTGHSQRVLHVAVNQNKDQIYSVGADQCFHIWDL